MEDLWKQVLAEIQLEVSHPKFQTFFKNTTLLSITDNVATIVAPNFMVTQLLEQNYFALIKRVLDKKTSSNNSLIFETKQVGALQKDPGPLFSQPAPTPTLKKRPARIKQDYNFDTFAVSDSNQLAYTAANAVALDPGGKYNPLFLYGTVGVGKTHLMHAIANEIVERNSSASVVYLTTEEFTNELVEAIQFKTTTQMRKKFRSADLLLLDDIQFLSGKERVQEELFHTFNTLIDKHCQVIFSSDRPPHEIKKIEARLASRFEGGLTIDIAPPDFELRTAILLIKSEKLGLKLTPELAKRAAEKITDSRALEGFLLRLMSYISSINATTITFDHIDKSLGKMREEKQNIHPDDVVNAVCNHFNIKTTQIKGSRRDASLVKPRHICMFLLKEEFGLTFVEIGNLLGGRDHTTVMHGVDKIREQLQGSTHMNEEILFIKKRVEEGYLQ